MNRYLTMGSLKVTKQIHSNKTTLRHRNQIHKSQGQRGSWHHQERITNSTSSRPISSTHKWYSKCRGKKEKTSQPKSRYPPKLFFWHEAETDILRQKVEETHCNQICVTRNTKGSFPPRENRILMCDMKTSEDIKPIGKSK